MKIFNFSKTFFIAFILFGVFGMIIGSCSNNSECNNGNIDKRELYQKKKQSYASKKFQNMHNDEVTYKKVICPKCNGVGEVEFSTAGKVVFGIITFGMGCLTTPTDRCETCYGTGYIEIPDI